MIPWVGDTPLELSEATGLPFTVCYFDNINVMTSGSFDDHMEHLDQVLSQLQNKGSQVMDLIFFCRYKF
jgi:hypothetical protein